MTNPGCVYLLIHNIHSLFLGDNALERRPCNLDYGQTVSSMNCNDTNIFYLYHSLAQKRIAVTNLMTVILSSLYILGAF